MHVCTDYIIDVYMYKHIHAYINTYTCIPIVIVLGSVAVRTEGASENSKCKKAP